MRSAILISEPSQDDGTIGEFTLDDGTKFSSIELPWRDNANNLSCVPSGKYQCDWFNSPKHGWCYLLRGTGDRHFVEIHIANWAGDIMKGLFSNLEGCIALGKSVGKIKPHLNQRAVLQSGVAIKEFHNNMKGESFMLTIKRGGQDEISTGS